VTCNLVHDGVRHIFAAAQGRRNQEHGVGVRVVQAGHFDVGAVLFQQLVTNAWQQIINAVHHLDVGNLGPVFYDGVGNTRDLPRLKCWACRCDRGAQHSAVFAQRFFSSLLFFVERFFVRIELFRTLCIVCGNCLVSCNF